MIKKLFLLLFISFIGIFSFTNASYNPSEITITDYDLLLGNYSCDEGSCELELNSNGSRICSVYYNNGDFGNSCSSSYLGDYLNGTFTLSTSLGYFDSITIFNGSNSSDYITITNGSNTQGGVGEGGEGDGGDSGESGTLLPNGTETLSPVVSSLGLLVFEFIPYVIYVSLGILGSIIGFFAIKWLVNYVRAIVLGMFKK